VPDWKVTNNGVKDGNLAEWNWTSNDPAYSDTGLEVNGLNTGPSYPRFFTRLQSKTKAPEDVHTFKVTAGVTKMQINGKASNTTCGNPATVTSSIKNFRHSKEVTIHLGNVMI
jgi:hypothetical protein